MTVKRDANFEKFMKCSIEIWIKLIHIFMNYAMIVGFWIVLCWCTRMEFKIESTFIAIIVYYIVRFILNHFTN